MLLPSTINSSEIYPTAVKIGQINRQPSKLDKLTVNRQSYHPLRPSRNSTSSLVNQAT